ncbi:hypothetical protein [Ralstonia pseudosolanacearum]|uniref:hypothetical protein n=1 Tax=Ralstonia pseudosolanacearum TaxID=1310165 RepID=UPI003CE9546C
MQPLQEVDAMANFRLGEKAAFSLAAEMSIQNIDRILENLEDFFPNAKAQAFLRKQQELSSCTDKRERDIIESELDLMEIEWRGSFPAYFFWSLLVLLWGEIEKLLDRFATEARSNKGFEYELSDIKGNFTYSRFRKYVQTILGARLQENNAVDDLQFLRNLYAHHSGEISSYPESKMKRINSIIQHNAGVSQLDSLILVDATYIRSAINNARSLFRTLSDIHPSGEPTFVETDMH